MARRSDGGEGAPWGGVARRVIAHAGLAPPDWALAGRARDRAAALGLDEAAYAARVVDGDDAELEALVEALRNGETRFYRHPGPLRLLEEAVKAVRGRAAARVRGWSAGCATGEEAWTLAMLLAEAGVEDFEVLGTDLSAVAMAQAQAAWYPAARVAALPIAWRTRWMVAERDGFSVVPELRPRVRFERRNLVEQRPGRRWDVVLCCNVLVHFDADAAAAMLRDIESSVAPGGYLVLGNGEQSRALAPVRDPSGAVIWWREAEALA